MLSRATQYAIRAMVFLAVQPPGKLSGAREIATTQNIPKPFLWKVLYRLRTRKLVRSFKGVGGGYELAHPPGRIRISEIAAIFEAAPIFQGCIFGLSKKPEPGPCPLHPDCKKINHDLLNLLKWNTLADLANPTGRRVPRR
jgi:Rrf2 family transcriptional regulator, iron-sulfur cluster assembly transcription factor